MIRYAGEENEADAAARRKRPTILVVDDSEHDREIYGRMLHYNGFDVVFAASGAAAMRLAPRVKADLVLLDLGLPDMSGLALLSGLRRFPGLGNVPVIALTACPRSSSGDAARRAGCVEYIEKPAGPVTVLHSVERRLGRPPLAGEGRPPRVIEAA